MSQLKSIFMVCLPPSAVSQEQRGTARCSCLPQRLLDLPHLLFPLLAGLKGLIEVHGTETSLVVGLRLGQPVAVGAYHGSDRRVASASYSIVQQHDRLDP